MVLLILTMLLVSLLTLLPFYDIDNLVTIISISSRLTTSKPALSGAGWPGGPFFLIVWIPTYLSYLYSGFSIFFAYIILKIILSGLSISLALSLTKFFPHRDRFNIFIFTILNPSLIYITLIWTQYDIIPVFFSTLSLLFLIDEDLRKSFQKTLLALIPMFIAILTTYYSILFIPALIIFSNDRKAKLNIFIGSIVLGFIFLITDILFFRGFGLSYIKNLDGNGLSSSFYEGLQFFIPIPLIYYVPFLLILTIIIPLTMKIYRYGMYTSMYVLILIFLYTSASAGFDTYLWLFPLSIISILESKNGSFKYSKMLILNIPILVEVIFSNFIMGTGYQQGIFYFGYSIFHTNYLFISTGEQFQYFVTIFNAILMTSVVSVIVFLLFINRKDKFEVNKRPLNLSHKHKKIGINDMVKILCNKKSMVIITLLLISIPTSLVFNNSYETISSHKMYDPPIGILYPSFSSNNGNFAMSVAGKTYTSVNNTITISQNSPEVSFYRGLSEENINLSLSILPYGNLNNGIFPIINTSTFVIGYASNLKLNLNRYNTENNLVSSNSIGKLNNISLYDKIVQEVSFSGSSYLKYEINNTFNNYYHLIAFQTNGSIINPEYLWFASNHNVSKALSMVIVKHKVIISYSNNSVPLYLTNLNDGNWNYILFKFNSTSMKFILNGVKVVVNYRALNSSGIFANGSYFTIGYPSSSSSLSFRGNISEAYYSNNPDIVLERYYYFKEGVSLEMIKNPNLNKSENVSFTDFTNITNINIGGHSFFSPNKLENLSIGKLTDGSWGDFIVFNSIQICSYSKNNYYIVAVFYFTFIPFFVPFLFYYLKRK